MSQSGIPIVSDIAEAIVPHPKKSVFYDVEAGTSTTTYSAGGFGDGILSPSNSGSLVNAPLIPILVTPTTTSGADPSPNGYQPGVVLAAASPVEAATAVAVSGIVYGGAQAWQAISPIATPIAEAGTAIKTVTDAIKDPLGTINSALGSPIDDSLLGEIKNKLNNLGNPSSPSSYNPYPTSNFSNPAQTSISNTMGATAVVLIIAGLMVATLAAKGKIKI